MCNFVPKRWNAFNNQKDLLVIPCNIFLMLSKFSWSMTPSKCLFTPKSKWIWIKGIDYINVTFCHNSYLCVHDKDDYIVLRTLLAIFHLQMICNILVNVRRQCLYFPFLCFVRLFLFFYIIIIVHKGIKNVYTYIRIYNGSIISQRFNVFECLSMRILK